MPSAIVLITCDHDSEESVIKEIRGIADVKEVKGLYGVYDIVVKVESNSMVALQNTITWKIREIPQLHSTVTLMVIERQGLVP